MQKGSVASGTGLMLSLLLILGLCTTLTFAMASVAAPSDLQHVRVDRIKFASARTPTPLAPWLRGSQMALEQSGAPTLTNR